MIFYLFIKVDLVEIEDLKWLIRRSFMHEIKQYVKVKNKMASDF